MLFGVFLVRLINRNLLNQGNRQITFCTIICIRFISRQDNFRLGFLFKNPLVFLAVRYKIAHYLRKSLHPHKRYLSCIHFLLALRTIHVVPPYKIPICCYYSISAEKLKGRPAKSSKALFCFVLTKSSRKIGKIVYCVFFRENS